MEALTNNILLSWEDYLEYGKRLFFKEKTVIFEQGDIGSGFYFVKKGLIKIKSKRNDENSRILDIVGPGRIIGEQTIDHLPYYSTAISHVDSILYYFTNNDFEELTQKYPEVITLLVHSLILKEKLLLNNINATSTDTHPQIAYSLLYLMDSYKSQEINLTQQELSLFVGVTRITIYKVLKQWVSEGILSINNRKIFIIDPQSLWEKC
ncbi:Crp/Fnr family transcriptional regulator [Bacillus massiliigorillae]|uniref:Crp/Fnr family transcriptional regulator n=1 Tax=Bacillus massiliigorillae TaxID=1243664 RepID=UPI0003A456DB|nr:Crp/Fnr family transcriptional regulator [Bacillus massiliigorillae]